MRRRGLCRPVSDKNRPRERLRAISPGEAGRVAGLRLRLLLNAQRMQGVQILDGRFTVAQPAIGKASRFPVLGVIVFV
jgi:hypothetical protein